MTPHSLAAQVPAAVVGGGTMGAGIAQVFAQAGHPVRLQARRPETLKARARISTTQDLGGAAFVSENIPEQLEGERTGDRTLDATHELAFLSGGSSRPTGRDGGKS